MVQRRQVLAVAGAGGITALSGCLGFVTGSEAAEFTASAARVSAAALDDTGYDFVGHEHIDIEEDVGFAGITREVRVRNYRAGYEKAVDLGLLGRHEAAVFIALTTPQARVLGREFNPVADMTAREIAEFVQNHYEGFDELDHVDDETLAVNDQDTTVSTFETRASLVGIDEMVDLTVLISESVDLGDDLVVTVGAYPEMSNEGANVRAMMAAVEPDD